MAPHSSNLAWKIPWTEGPGGLQSMGSWRVRPDWTISLLLFAFCVGEGNGNPPQCSCLENRKDGGAWWAAVSGVTQSRTRLKRLSSSGSSRDGCGSGIRGGRKERFILLLHSITDFVTSLYYLSDVLLTDIRILKLVISIWQSKIQSEKNYIMGLLRTLTNS